MESTFAHTFVQRWITDWNNHDLPALLSHYRDDVVFTSPVAARIVQSSGGVIEGKAALASYWTLGLQLLPDLHFELLDYYLGVTTLVINYRNERGNRVCEVLTFDGDLIVTGHGTYLDD